MYKVGNKHRGQPYPMVSDVAAMGVVWESTSTEGVCIKGLRGTASLYGLSQKPLHQDLAIQGAELKCTRTHIGYNGPDHRNLSFPGISRERVEKTRAGVPTNKSAMLRHPWQSTKAFRHNCSHSNVLCCEVFDT